MADLSNITALSGLTITSDQTSGTSNPYATFAVSSVTTTQRDLLENVTPYTANGTTVKIKEGTIIFNITVGNLQMFRDGAWENITTNITTATGVGLSSAPFSIPSGTKADVEVAANQVEGFIYYDTTDNDVRGYIDANWMTLFTSNTNNAGSSLTTGAPFVLPSGQKNAIENLTDNQVRGFIYYDTTASIVRGYIHNDWMTLFTVVTTDAAAGLTTGAPFVFPSGPRASVEINFNEQNGFTYFDSTNTVLRTYKDGWHTISMT
jgi:hypothetical protein